MGWSFHIHPSTRAAFIAERIATKQEHDDNGKLTRTWTVTHHSVRGNNIWMVQEVRDETGALVDHFIALDMIASDHGCWGYKDLSEQMGPTAKDCPLSFLDIVPCPNSDYAREWRGEVRAWHAGKREQAKRAKTLRAGQRWMLTAAYGGKACELVRPSPSRKGWWLASVEGTTYRVRSHMLEREMGKKEVTIEQFTRNLPEMQAAML